MQYFRVLEESIDDDATILEEEPEVPRPRQETSNSVIYFAIGITLIAILLIVGVSILICTQC